MPAGKKGGGSVQVGGDFHGGGTLAHANTTTVDTATTINADATGARGNGGSVVLWSDGRTQFLGQISARGGALGGNGGSAEVSSGNVLTYRGWTDLRAPAGTVGTLLLDPKNITISDDPDDPAVGALALASTFGTTDLDGGSTNVTLNADGLGNSLGLANIILEANNNIRFSASVTGDTVTLGNGNLTLRAGNSILFDSGVVLTLKGSFMATFNDSGATAMYRDGTNPITNAQGAVFNMAGTSKIIAPGGVTIQGGTLARYFNGTAVVNSTAAANTGAITLTDVSTGAAGAGITVQNNAAGAGKDITVNGPLNTTPTAANANGGGITLVSTGVLTTGALTTDGSGTGTGGAISLTGGTANNLNGVISGGSLTTVGNVPVNLGTDTVTTTSVGGQTYNGAVVLGSTADTTLTANGNGPIFFGSTVGGTTAGAQALVLNTAGLQTFTLAVGTPAIPLASLTTGSGPVRLNGGAVTTSGPNGQIYNGTVTLGAATTTLTANGSGPIFFGSTIAGATAGNQNLELFTSGLQTFTLAVGTPAIPLAGLTTGAGPVRLNGGAVTTSGVTGQIYNGLVTLGLAGGTVAVPVTTTLTADGGPIMFVSKVEGATASTQALVLTGASTQTFGNTVGATNALASLSTGTVNLNGGTVRTYGAQTYLGPVKLGIAGATMAAPALTALTSLNGGEISFHGTVNGNAAGTQALSIDTAGNETFAGLVGSASALASLTTDPATVGGQVNFNAVGSAANPSVKTTGAQTYNDDVRLGNATVLVGTTLTLGTGRTLDGSNATGQGSNGAFINNLTLEFSGATILLSGGVTNDGTVVPAATGTFNNINNFVSSSVAGVTLIGDFTTVGGQNFDGLTGATGSPLILGNPAAAMNSFTLTSTGGGNITFGPINATAGSLTRALTVNTGGITTFNGRVGAVTPLTALTLDSTGALGGSTIFNVPTAGVTVTTVGVPGVFGDGAQTYNDPVKFQLATTLSSSNAATPANAIIAFGSTIDGPGALTINTSAPITFSTLIGNTTALAGLSITAPNTTFTIDAGTSTLNRGAVNVGATGLTIPGPVNFGFLNASLTDASHPGILSSGPQTYGDGGTGNNVTLSGNTSLFGTAVSTGTGIMFNGTIDGAFALSVAASGTSTFKMALGGTTPLASLQVFTSGFLNGGTVFGPGVTLVRTGSNTGADFQQYNTAVVLQGDTTFRSATADGSAAGSGNITFGRTVDGTTANAQSLTVDTLGTTTFGFYVGATTALNALTTGESGVPGGATAFQFNLSGLAAVGKGGVNASSVTIYNPVVFSITGSSTAHPSIVTTGAQSYASATAALETADTFLRGATLNVPAGINGQGHDLTLDFSGAIVVDGSFINIKNFASVGSGGTQIGTPGGLTFTTTGFQNYTNAVTLTSDVTLASGNSDITFASTLNGPFALVLQPGTGTAFFNGAVGGTPATNLASLTVNGNTSIGGGAVTTVGQQNYFGSLTLTNPAILTSTAGNQITANSLVGGGKDLTVNAGSTAFGVVTNGGNLLFNVGPGTGAAFTGTVDALSLRVTGGIANLSGNVTTNNATLGQSYAQLQLNGSVTLRDNASGPISSGLIDGSGAGGQTLAISTGGAITFNGAVGSSLALGSLTTGGGGKTFFNVGGNGVTVTTVANGTTTGTQTYNEAVVLQQATTLFSLASGAATNAGAVLFGGTVDSATTTTPISLTVLAGNGQTVFGPGATVNANALNIGGASVTFNGSVGSNAKLNVLTVGVSGVYTTGTHTIDLNGGLVTSTLGQTYNDPVTLSADTVLKDTNGGNIAFNTTINGDGVAPRTLSLSTTGGATFGGVIGKPVRAPRPFRDRRCRHDFPDEFHRAASRNSRRQRRRGRRHDQRAHDVRRGGQQPARSDPRDGAVNRRANLQRRGEARSGHFVLQYEQQHRLHGRGEWCVRAGGQRLRQRGVRRDRGRHQPIDESDNGYPRRKQRADAVQREPDGPGSGHRRSARRRGRHHDQQPRAFCGDGQHGGQPERGNLQRRYADLSERGNVVGEHRAHGRCFGRDPTPRGRVRGWRRDCIRLYRGGDGRHAESVDLHRRGHDDVPGVGRCRFAQRHRCAGDVRRDRQRVGHTVYPSERRGQRTDQPERRHLGGLHRADDGWPGLWQRPPAWREHDPDQRHGERQPDLRLDGGRRAHADPEHSRADLFRQSGGQHGGADGVDDQHHRDARSRHGV